ncbi:FAD-dependent oxidoreductase [Paenibacillus sp. N1-5-1-14]|uniref:phytoene desaturase family protein n=1 Tax=Paenibacillus radicibacter TaxID=2972488 RepID=UPI0021598DD5|nr:FAD-dependent oxidoreductase [Paenibacillus radicibacter]MCR8643799.1 FAD-dependent oxidoreductase [Paenibacillus radicibacter]
MVLMMKYDVAVIGGGIAGLTAAIYTAKAGKQVVVIEKQERLGGRAMTNYKNGAFFNLGGHALYFGDAYHTFRELGLSLQGNKPSTDAHGVWKDTVNTLPLSVTSLLTTPLLTWKGKMEFASWFTKLTKLDTHKYDHISLREWIEGHIKDPMLRNIFYALLRTTSYVASPDLLAAGPVLKQLASSMKGVLYLDRGWAPMVEQLRQLAVKLGVHFVTKNKVVAVGHQNGVVQHVRCEDGTQIEASHVIMTVSPAIAHQLVPDAEYTALHTWRDQAMEATVACLDVTLKRLPKPKQQFVYGIDQTVFLSNHSRAAYVTDDGSQLITLCKYQGPTTDAQQDLQDLEHMLDLVQPGWRDVLVAKQYLPKITVSYDFMHTKRVENPGPAVPEIKGLYVAGEWVTHGELLVDAATASARRAAEHIIAHDRSERTANYGHRNII